MRGAALALLAALNVWAVAQAGPSSGAAASTSPALSAHTSPIALVGQVYTWLFGVGAYPTLALPLALGALWLAEGVARQRLLRRWLAIPTVSLWLLIELGARLIGGTSAGGALGGLLGNALAARLAHTPQIVVQLIVLAVGMLLALAMGVGVANHIGSALVTLPGGALTALRRPRRTRSAQRPIRPTQTALSPTSHANTYGAAASHANAQATRTGKDALAPGKRPDDVVALAEALAGRAQEALQDERAMTQVYPLRITATTIRLCIRPVKRLKRDAAGRIVRDAQGVPVVVRTRVSRILALRATLAEALDAPNLRLAPLPPDGSSDDDDQPLVVVEVARR
jgi:hypothetical protein